MLLPPEQEQDIIERNMPKIYRAVDNFMARCSTNVTTITYDDCVQEVSIAFLKYIRKCETLEDTEKFPWFSATGAMRDLVLSSQPMTCPKSQHRFSEIIHSMPSTMSLDVIGASSGFDVDGMSKHWVDDKETQIDFDLFMCSQPENIRRIVSMRLYGMSEQKIAAQCGVSHVAIWKKLKKLSDAYKDYSGGAKNA